MRHYDGYFGTRTTHRLLIGILNKTHYNNFKETVKTAFSYRRKTVLNALVEKYKKDKVALAKILVSSGLKVSSRAEEVSAKNYALLAKNLEGFIF